MSSSHSIDVNVARLAYVTLAFIDEPELQTMLGAGKHVVVDFFAEWCQPCELLTPELDKLASMFNDRIEFVKINVDENPGLTLSLGIMSIPTVVHFSEAGKEVARSVGVAKADDLVSLLSLQE